MGIPYHRHLDVDYSRSPNDRWACDLDVVYDPSLDRRAGKDNYDPVLQHSVLFLDLVRDQDHCTTNLRGNNMSTIKFGKVSVNLKTGKVNIDRRTIKKADPSWHHIAYVAAGLLATVVVADYIRNK
ncbi:hypothetical protein D3C87_1121670 [compost metagenome]